MMHHEDKYQIRKKQIFFDDSEFIDWKSYNWDEEENDNLLHELHELYEHFFFGLFKQTNNFTTSQFRVDLFLFFIFFISYYFELKFHELLIHF